MEGTSPGYAPDQLSCNHGINIDPEGFVMTITTVGIDLAKNVFAVYCVDQNGKAVLVKPKVSCAALPELIADLPVLSH